MSGARILRTKTLTEGYMMSLLRPIRVSGEDWNGANFAEDEDTSDEAVVGGILDSLGESGEAWIEHSRTPENKEALKKQTERAIELRIFGTPSFVAEDGELFWGDDRIEEALAWASKRKSGAFG
ncbi:MAG: DsbA family protein [Rubrobacter sp.]|nr:DsbA family protein [Rubrobacter sp.]